MTTQRPPTPSDDGSDTGDRLIQAAFEMFVEEGFERAKVQEIAARAGFTTGAIYGRFDNKTALLAGAIARYGASFLEATLENLAAHPERSVLAEVALETQVGPTTPLHGVLTDVSAIAVRDEQVRDALIPLLDAVRDRLTEAVTEAQRSGEIDPALSAVAVVHLAVTLMMGSFMMKALSMSQPPRDDAEAVMARVVASFLPTQT